VKLEEAPPREEKKPSGRKGETMFTPGHVQNDAVMRGLLPELRKLRFDVRGNRRRPEPPRLVAKVCSEDGRGELWLGPLPTESRMDRITDTWPSIQIYCFAKYPTDCEVEPRGEQGMFIPHTMNFRLEMSNPHGRSRDIRALKTILINSLRQGDNAYVHCISGLSRAPVAAALIGADLMGVTFRDAQGIIDQTRHVSWDDRSKMLGPWLGAVLQEDVVDWVVPTGFSCSATRKDEVVVHATTVNEGGTEPICRWKKGSATKQDFKRDNIQLRALKRRPSSSEASSAAPARSC
jgi:hypothetical protein